MATIEKKPQCPISYNVKTGMLGVHPDADPMDLRRCLLDDPHDGRCSCSPREPVNAVK